MIRVLLVDDQAIVRGGLRLAFSGFDDIVVVGEAGNGAEAVRAAVALKADVVVMDVRMPVLDGIAATAELAAALPTARVLVLTTFADDGYVFGALRAGASGYLLKDADPDAIVAAVRTVAAGDALVAPAVTRRLVEAALSTGEVPDRATDPALASLTAREHDILLELAGGLSNAAIAERLCLSEPTVKTHLSNLLGKLGLRSRVQAVIYAYETGLVRPGGVDLERLGQPDD